MANMLFSDPYEAQRSCKRTITGSPVDVVQVRELKDGSVFKFKLLEFSFLFWKTMQPRFDWHVGELQITVEVSLLLCIITKLRRAVFFELRFNITRRHRVLQAVNCRDLL